jgi:hypothetical protein
MTLPRIKNVIKRTDMKGVTAFLALMAASLPAYGQQSTTVKTETPQWVKTEYRDELHNESGVEFFLAAHEKGGGIDVTCSKGKLKAAWLLTDKVADATVRSSLTGDLSSEVDVEYRRDAEPKPHHLSLQVSSNFHGVLLQRSEKDRSRGFADIKNGHGFENLMYGPVGLGGGEWHRNKKANNWAKKLVVGIPAYGDSDSVFTFDVPDPSVVNSECGIK